MGDYIAWNLATDLKPTASLAGAERRHELRALIVEVELLWLTFHASALTLFIATLPLSRPYYLHVWVIWDSFLRL
jgi:hypothetical protein